MFLTGIWCPDWTLTSCSALFLGSFFHIILVWTYSLVLYPPGRGTAFHIFILHCLLLLKGIRPGSIPCINSSSCWARSCFRSVAYSHHVRAAGWEQQSLLKWGSWIFLRCALHELQAQRGCSRDCPRHWVAVQRADQGLGYPRGLGWYVLDRLPIITRPAPSSMSLFLHNTKYYSFSFYHLNSYSSNLHSINFQLLASAWLYVYV